MLQFTVVLKIVFPLFQFLRTVSFSWPPPSAARSCTRGEDLHITSQSVCSEMLVISSSVVCLTAFKSIGCPALHITFPITIQKEVRCC